jgi:hypothetical protein
MVLKSKTSDEFFFYLCTDFLESNYLSMTTISLSEQEIIRRNSLQKLREMGIDPYPAAQYPVNALTAEIKKEFSPESIITRKFALQAALWVSELWERPHLPSCRIPVAVFSSM